jgi:tetratricopeptide (TPR) repeat protein
MRYIITSWWACMFLLTVSSTKAHAQALEAADSLFAIQQYDLASVMYERAIYERPNDIYFLTFTLLSKTNCLKAQGKFDQIGSLLSRVDLNQINDSLKQEIYLQKALGYYLSDNFEVAEKNILPSFNLEIYNTKTQLNSVLLYTFILDELGKWDQAHQVINNYIRNQTQIPLPEREKLTQSLDSLYATDQHPKLRSIKKAKTLSLIFPGLGQSYNGNYGKGFLNFLLTGGSATFGVINVLQTNYITAATAGVYLFLYFYLGGANQSSYLVPTKNYAKKRKYNDQLKSKLIDATHTLTTTVPTINE